MSDCQFLWQFASCWNVVSRVSSSFQVIIQFNLNKYFVKSVVILNLRKCFCFYFTTIFCNWLVGVVIYIGWRMQNIVQHHRISVGFRSVAGAMRRNSITNRGEHDSKPMLKWHIFSCALWSVIIITVTNKWINWASIKANKSIYSH